jgi:peptidyl-prolyl cis-trans isomerase C
MSNATSLHNYFILRGSLLTHERLPWELNEEERQQLEVAVAREERLVTRALASSAANDLAATVSADASSAEADLIAALQQKGEPQQLLAQAGLDRVALHQAMIDELVAAAVLDQVMAAADPSEPEVLQWFEKNRERFVAPERREAFHILVTINDEYAENSRDQARERIASVAAQLEKQPERFAELAQSYSECPTAVEAGRLGVLPRGQLYQELEEALFAMAEGGISGVLESPLGFHLLRCGAIEAARELQWEEVKDSLMQRLAERQRKRHLQAWLTGMH